MSATTNSGYKNNNDINRTKVRMENKRARPSASCCARLHLNSLWSLWYGFFGTILQAYVGVKGVKRILGYSLVPWPDTGSIPILELNTSLALTGVAALLLPFFLGSAAFKIGNLANDGFKLGRQLSICSRDPQSELLGSSGGCSLFKHGGPTSPFLHLIIAFCLLVPKLLMEARLIEADIIGQESLWHTDLDFMTVHNDRLVVLSFMTSPNTSALIAPPPPPSTMPFFALDDGNQTQPRALPLTNYAKKLREMIGSNGARFSFNSHSDEDKGWGCPVSIEYMNFALALMVYAVRYPAVFWSTNKFMGIVFSLQMFLNSLQILVTYAGMSVLYKVQVLGAWKSLPLLKPQPGGVSPLGGVSPFLLNAQVTLALHILSSLLVLSSSLVLYLYGHTRFNAFLNQERDRKVVVFNEGGATSKWSYFTHCAALCVFVSIGVCNAPLLHDYTVVYRGSLDGAVLVCIIATIFHLFLWMVVWLFLTIKQKWVFKLRVTVGRATVRQARSVKLVTDVDLMTHHSEDPSLQPLLVVGNGRTYSIAEHSPKKAIMGVIQKAALSKKAENGVSGHVTDDDGEEQIYWLRPALAAPKHSPDKCKPLCWFNRKPKPKVTFNETSCTSAARGKSGGARRMSGMETDDGDYATLRELALPPPPPLSDTDTASEEGKLLACVHDEHVTYASTSQDLAPPIDYEDPSPLLTPEPLSPERSAHHLLTKEGTIIVHNSQHPMQTPRCLRRADSGVPHDELTYRSDSISTECSASPPDPPGSNHSETSSGVHSNESSEQAPPTTVTAMQQSRRATSIADLIQNAAAKEEEVHWRSCSLQRNVAPPTHANHTPHFTTNPIYGFRTNGRVSGACDLVEHGVPAAAVIRDNATESTVVIRRKLTRPKTNEIISTSAIIEEPFERATNMRMISFTEGTDLNQIQSSSATLPHYPTQPIVISAMHAHCATMPLPQPHHVPATPPIGSGNSCNLYTRAHTTIPTHHNGIRLFSATPTPHPYVKRLQFPNGAGRVGGGGAEAIYTGVNRASGEIYHYNS